uniref:Anion exchange protein n=1 Tax=Ditylenchus dipsaci TaxID=166011 RepID=A0A915EB49_9BILA
MSMGIYRPTDEGSSIRKRRMSKQRESLELPDPKNMADMAPGTRVMFLLKEKDDVPALFTEMGELTRSGNSEEWKETARWVKFEEDVEEGGNRWSKPHVATLSLHALFQLRSCILNGVVLIDLDIESLPQLIEKILDELINTGCLQESERDDVRHVLSRRHTHQYEQGGKNGSTNGSSQGGFLNAVRSISDIGRSFSHGKNLHKTSGVATDAESDGSPKKVGNQLELPKVGSLPKDMHKDASTSDFGRNAHFMKKLPPGVEASNVLVGEVDFLAHHITAFVRLKDAQMLGDLTEVPVPTRFLFLLLGPSGHAAQFKEIGRAIATLMSDEIFHDVAYKARDRTDLLDGVDEFLDSVTVLPPGEWDPNIRIEPPTVIPSQQKRVQAPKQMLNNMDLYNAAAQGLQKGGQPKKNSLEEEDGHANDPALQRTGKLCGGLIADIKRKLPFYKSDFTDAFNMQSVATFCFMYFALLAPIVTFGGLLEEATHQRMAAMENLASGAICGVIYHLFSGQPLTIIGSTGPVLVFETIVFDLCTTLGIQYLSFRLWVHIWTALILLAMVVTDASSLVSYITRFTEESFATLIAVIFIYEAIMKLYKISESLDVIQYTPLAVPNMDSLDPIAATMAPTVCQCVSSEAPVQNVIKLAHKYHWENLIPHNTTFVDYSTVSLSQCKRLLGRLEGDSCFVLYDRFLMSLVLMLGTFFLAITFKKMRNSCYFPSKVRQVMSDFAVMLAIVLMTCTDMLVGINTPKLNVPSTFRPTWKGRGWLIPLFDGNPLWTAAVALLPAILACILIFMDQQISAVIVNRKENKLKKGCGYHLDLFVLSLLIIIVGFLGLPIYVAATVLSINHVNSLKMESESRAPGEVAHFIGVREQRVTGMVTFLLVGLSINMTKILSHIPMPVLYGVFLYMGIAALGGIQLFDRILLLLMPMKYQPDTIYIRHVPISVIHRFTMCQVGCLVVLWIVKSIKSTSIAFPIMLVVMVAVRKLMEKCFSEKDLKYLDDKMPDFHLRKKEDMRRKSKGEDIEIDLDENQGTIHAVKTEAHLHIPMTSAMSSRFHWQLFKSLATTSTFPKSSTQVKMVGSSGASEHGNTSPRLATPEEDDEAITINIVKSSSDEASPHENQPLLKKENQNESPV